MPFLNIVVLLPLLLTLPVHDRLLNTRVHGATLWGVLLIFAVFFPLIGALVFTDAGPGLVRLLGSVSL
jgi:hypothetical protein